jgi:hypothetical protein
VKPIQYVTSACSRGTHMFMVVIEVYDWIVDVILYFFKKPHCKL